MKKISILIVCIALLLANVDLAYGDPVNLAMGKKILMGDSAPGTSINSIADGDISTFWQAADKSNKEFIIDLGSPQFIQSINITARQDDVDKPEERRNFQVLLSNDISFSTFYVAGVCTFIPYRAKGKWECKTEAKASYRYVKVHKLLSKINEGFSLAEFAVVLSEKSVASVTAKAATTTDFISGIFKNGASIYYKKGERLSITTNGLISHGGKFYVLPALAVNYTNLLDGCKKLQYMGKVYYSLDDVAAKVGMDCTYVMGDFVIVSKNGPLFTGEHNKYLYEQIKAMFAL